MKRRFTRPYLTSFPKCVPVLFYQELPETVAVSQKQYRLTPVDRIPNPIAIHPNKKGKNTRSTARLVWRQAGQAGSNIWNHTRMLQNVSMTLPIAPFPNPVRFTCSQHRFSRNLQGKCKGVSCSAAKGERNIGFLGLGIMGKAMVRTHLWNICMYSLHACTKI